MREVLDRARQRLEEAADAEVLPCHFRRRRRRSSGAALAGFALVRLSQNAADPDGCRHAGAFHQPAELWFDTTTPLRAGGLDPRYHAALPNLLVGVGLLFTFVGLLLALGAAGSIVAEGATQNECTAGCGRC